MFVNVYAVQHVHDCLCFLCAFKLGEDKNSTGHKTFAGTNSMEPKVDLDRLLGTAGVEFLGVSGFFHGERMGFQTKKGGHYVNNQSLRHELKSKDIIRIVTIMHILNGHKSADIIHFPT